MLEEELEFRSDGVLSSDESVHLQAHIDRARVLLAKLIPRIPLDWVAALVRVGLAVIIFILLIGPPFTYFRSLYYLPAVSTISSATGTVSVRQYVPEIVASNASEYWRRRDIAGPADFARNIGKGMTAGVTPADIGEGEVGVAVYWTEEIEGKRALRKLVTDAFFRSERTVTSGVWNDQDFTSAVALGTTNTVLVAAAYMGTDGGRLAMQTFDLAGKAIGNRQDIDLDPGASVDDLQAVPWEGGWAIVTRIPKGVEASLFDPTPIAVRVFDAKLAELERFELSITGYEVGAFPLVLPDVSGGGYSVIATGHPSIRSGTEPTGDRLFAFQYNAAAEIVRVMRLTNTGGQHDFMTTGFSRLPDGSISVGTQNILGWSFDDESVAYPKESGRAYMRFFDRAYQVAGTVIVFDDVPSKDSSDRNGVAHLRQTLIGNRMYVAYDMLHAKNDDSGTSERTVYGMWLHITK